MVGIVTRGVGASTVIKIVIQILFAQIAENRYLLIFGNERIATLQLLPSYF
jgi:hypothetical protein